MISLKSIDIHKAPLERKYVESCMWLPCIFIVYSGFLSPVQSFLFFQLNFALYVIFELTLIILI